MIAAEGLTYRYGDAVALDDVSLRIDDGEFVVLAGANGSGKTTLVRHFNGLLSPDEGEVRIDGESVEDDPVLARTTVGMVFQNPRDCFVAATVAEDVAFGPENLGHPREEIESRVDAALEAVDMADQRTARIDQLSGGEQARVAIAGTLAMDPDHLVLDEPFTGLDWPAQKAVLERLDELSASGTSIVVVTHDLRDLLSRADRVVALADGRIAFDESPENARKCLEDADIRPC
ncbi:energy-coupling factor ABC transporter ATP-binding protein [Natronomonas amylolytica]|uniref:energy-coupling factor ABC transporter ATP-binding protein n=1 Tax=Natronomonas amylolytica TaxID=3108498 RepID=UPI00300AFCF4